MRFGIPLSDFVFYIVGLPLLGFFKKLFQFGKILFNREISLAKFVKLYREFTHL